MSLRVLDPGLATRVVAGGRPRTRSLGVPVGGAADRTAHALGNGLVGNPPFAAALEVCLKGPVLRADAALAAVVFGAPFTLSSARQTLRVGVTFNLEIGEEIHVGATSSGMRAYFCVRGGLETPSILHSQDGLENVKAGDVLPCAAATIRKRFLREPEAPARATSPPSLARRASVILPSPSGRGVGGEGVNVRVIAGPQTEWFDEKQFYDQEFRVSKNLNRMGIRLEGEPLTMPARELVSEPVCPGAIQATADGQCIMLGVDGQTIGGYPKIAQVIQADLDLLGQLRPGETIRFEKVSLAEAENFFHQRSTVLQEWLTRLRVSLDAW
ncbi:MAG: biotin-dependent carboxyltransferase family protein [Gemmataceae bacterium]|nr:biotin-dependent carboxyltransferase family protein [Gemmataceae bacterium]